MTIDKETFLKVVEATPFVSIDLIIRNERNEVLLGYRRNRPAQHTWFVPGGRIRKNERAQDALQRIARTELGIAAPQGKLIGVFDHIYEDNFFDAPGIGTHYVVCGYTIHIPSSTRFIQDDQHAELKWWKLDELLHSTQVHANSKLYFGNAPENGLRCT
ncbi:MAG: GDP-mannose mannosyl hydrolase [Burkholderiaceae bacterium]